MIFYFNLRATPKFSSQEVSMADPPHAMFPSLKNNFKPVKHFRNIEIT